MTADVQSIVVGAGAVGLAVGRALAMAGHEVMLLEQHALIGSETSSRNSEVIHAGIYYPPGSLRATLCVRGKELLYAFCAENNVPHARCGKLLVATQDSQLPKLAAIKATAERNGVTDLEPLGGNAATRAGAGAGLRRRRCCRRRPASSTATATCWRWRATSKAAAAASCCAVRWSASSGRRTGCSAW